MMASILNTLNSVISAKYHFNVMSEVLGQLLHGLPLSTQKIPAGSTSQLPHC